MKKAETYGTVTDGILKVHNRDRFNNDIKHLSNGRVRVIVEKIYKKRSQQENGYYWGCIIETFRDCVEAEWGQHISKDEAHSMLKYHCNYTEQFTPDGQILRMPVTTADLTTIQFEEYLIRCRNLIHEYFNTVTPLPNEQVLLTF